jgi:NDP-sugar pyrophosphorylase family protein
MSKSKSLSIFFLCAGFGKRLRPLTSRIPKPLIPFQGKSALQLIWEKVQVLEPKKIVCNSHHLPGRIAGEARQLGMEVIHERELMGTGGCLGHAKSILNQTDYFLMHNGDVLHDIDLAEFVNQGMESDVSATLAAVNKPSINTLEIGRDNRLTGVKDFFHASENADNPVNLTYCGIGLYQKAFLDVCRPVPTELKHIWAMAIHRQFPILVKDCSKESWFDFGSPASLLKTAKWQMDITGNYSYKYPESKKNEKPFVSNEAGISGLPVGLRETLVLEAPAGPVPAKSKRKIWGADFCWDL